MANTKNLTINILIFSLPWIIWVSKTALMDESFQVLVLLGGETAKI